MSASKAATALDLCREALRKGVPPPELDGMLAEVQQILAQSKRRAETRERLADLARLESKLAHLPPGDRAAAIRERMRLSKSGYYKLRSQTAQSTRKRGLLRGLIMKQKQEKP